jgi:Zn-finger nucleic acid-binding protein
MQCPIDNTNLEHIEENDISIYRCTTCEGIWINDTDINKILEATSKMEKSFITIAQSGYCLVEKFYKKTDSFLKPYLKFSK